MRAATITPVGPPVAYLARFPGGIGLPRYPGGSAPTLALSRPAQCSLALRPARSADLQKRPFLRVLQTIRRLLIRSECFRLEREFAGPVFHRGEQCTLARRTKQSGGELASGGATTRAQNAGLQVGSIGPALPQHACRRPQYLQPSTPSRLALDTADFSSRGREPMAKRNYGRMTADGGLSLFRPMQLNLTMPPSSICTGSTCRPRRPPSSLHRRWWGSRTIVGRAGGDQSRRAHPPLDAGHRPRPVRPDDAAAGRDPATSRPRRVNEALLIYMSTSRHADQTPLSALPRPPLPSA